MPRLATVDEHQEPINAAPEIDFAAGRGDPPVGWEGLRIVPSSASYFTAKAQYTDDLLKLYECLRIYQSLPVCRPGDAPKSSWRVYEQYRKATGDEPIKRTRYNRMIAICRRLNQIHPSIVPPEVNNVLEKFRIILDPSANKAKPILIDEFGRAKAIGRRKASSAQVWLVEGEGETLVNGKSLAEAFPRVHDRESVVWALKQTDRINKYNIWALVSGGGTTGQAEAITLGVGRALLAHEPLLKPNLRRAGCIQRDPRRVERKKPGKLKARKMPAWVKR
ncbi:MAG: 37S ribosomal protein S9, mitochondrial [Alyxoria varia]|nr:MAG: 37S ribosomal protein S9, mitochondrial [Alyxoria varia]